MLIFPRSAVRKQSYQVSGLTYINVDPVAMGSVSWHSQKHRSTSQRVVPYFAYA